MKNDQIVMFDCINRFGALHIYPWHSSKYFSQSSIARNDNYRKDYHIYYYLGIYHITQLNQSNSQEKVIFLYIFDDSLTVKLIKE